MNNGPFFAADDGARLSNEIGEGEFVIGRAFTCDLVVDVGALSRRHVAVTRRGGVCRIRDLASRNGTFVNGDELGESEHLLVDGDVVVLAGTLRLIFRDPMATPMAPRIGALSGIWIDPDTAAVWVDAARIEPPLSARQLALLTLLNESVGEVVSRITIVDVVWADVAAAGVSDDAVSALVRRLRARLREGPLGTEWIEIVKTRGIRLLAPQ